MINNQSQLILNIRQNFLRNSPELLALLGRNENDDYEVNIEPEANAKLYLSMIWRKLVPAGSSYVEFLHWLAFRVMTQDANTVWVGCEVVRPHSTRGAYIEACYGRFTRQSAVACLESLSTLPQKSEGEKRSQEQRYLYDPVELASFFGQVIQDLRNGKAVDRRVPHQLGALPTPRHRPWSVDEPWKAPVVIVGSAVVLAGCLGIAAWVSLSRR